MKIAVCLSGQPRTIDVAAPSILKYFSGDYECDFFCHVWDYNTYKRKKSNAPPGEQPVYWEGDIKVDVDWLDQKVNLFNPKKYTIDSAEAIGAGFSWASLTYSMMMANHLKKQYEIENNFRYDCVVKSRYDLIFDPRQNFGEEARRHILNQHRYLDIVCLHSSRMSFEYDRVNASDTLLYGSSTAMDLLSELYRKIQKHLVRQDDFDIIGPGGNISDHAETRNLRMINNHIQTTVFRPEVSDIDPLTVDGYQQISDYSNTFYKL
jgi:hypothetical protein